MTFTVYVDDNFHYMDKGARTTAGEYESADEALARAKEVVDDCLSDHYKEGMSAKGLYDSYVAFGDDPFIVGPSSVEFSAWDYARTRAAEMCAT